MRQVTAVKNVLNPLMGDLTTLQMTLSAFKLECGHYPSLETAIVDFKNTADTQLTQLRKEKKIDYSIMIKALETFMEELQCPRIINEHSNIKLVMSGIHARAGELLELLEVAKRPLRKGDIVKLPANAYPNQDGACTPPVIFSYLDFVNNRSSSGHEK